MEDNVIGHVLIEIDIVPQALVHVPCRADAIVSGTQFLGILWRGPQAAAVKNLDIHIAEPLGACIETEHVVAIWVVHRGERHLFIHAWQRQAIVSEFFYVHSLCKQ